MPNLFNANDLACKTSSEVKSWLDDVLSRKIETSSEFNWLGLAEVAGSNAREAAVKDERFSSIEWAEISLRIYEKLSKSSDKTISHSLKTSAMMLRVFMINSFGNLKENHVFDVQKVFDWFYDNLDLSLDSALEFSNKFKGLIKDKKFSELETNRNELIKIRKIKNCLGVIGELKLSDKIFIEDGIQKWLVEKDNLI